MSIKLKVTDETKKQLANLNIETQVLSKLTVERKAFMDALGREILVTNGLDPKLYSVVFSPANDKWEAVLKPDALTIPAPGTNLQKIKGNGG